MALHTAWRQELFCSSPEQLMEAAALLRRHQHCVAGLNVPNKQKGEAAALIERCRSLHELLPAANVCCHFSINANYCRTGDASYAAFEEFAAQLAAIPRTSLLLVSGGGPRRKGLCSLQALRRAAGSAAFRALHLPLAVAFNPFLPEDGGQRAEEEARLAAKLEAGRGLIAAVYLQARWLAGHAVDGRVIESLPRPALAGRLIAADAGCRHGICLPTLRRVLERCSPFPASAAAGGQRCAAA